VDRFEAHVNASMYSDIHVDGTFDGHLLKEVTLTAATPQAQKLLADTAGALLLAEFSIRTFVKSAAPPPGTQPAAKPGAPRARS